MWAAQGWKNKLGAAFTNSASVAGDKQTALYTMFTLAQQHGVAWVGTGLMPSNAKAARRDDVHDLSLVRRQGRWVVVNKVFADMPVADMPVADMPVADMPAAA